MVIFIDASVFLGMNSKNEETRLKCKNFFIQKTNQTIYMSLEDVGRCDNIIWNYSRKAQDLYYPFMDKLHTIMDIQRVAYTFETIQGLSSFKAIKNFSNQMLLALIQNYQGTLYTLNPDLLSSKFKAIKTIQRAKEELFFTEDLEKSYQNSLNLRIP